MKKNRLFVVLLLISLLIMTITACGGSESNGEPAEAVSETSEQAETPDPAETPETSETAEPGDDTTDNDSGVLDPEFKKTMDDYEAWFNHYCEVMKKYEEDPSDLELMSEVADLLTEEQEMLDECLYSFLAFFLVSLLFDNEKTSPGYRPDSKDCRL